MKSAKSHKSVLSIKSTKSTRSTKTNFNDMIADADEVLDFGNMLQTACAKFQCPYAVIVKKEQQQDEFYKSLKYGDVSTKPRKLSVMPQFNLTADRSVIATSNSSKSLKEAASTEVNINTLIVVALYDTYNCLSEILISRQKVPRILMQVMSLLVYYHRNLTTLTVRQCRIDCYVLYEISKILEKSSITSLVLDECPVSEQNYDILINNESNLRSLTISKCKIVDDCCKLIAAKLHYGGAADNLQLLNLSSNHITDIGAKYLSDALRSNRRLRYLNLSSNRITDAGATHILDVLTEFPLTYDEILNKRKRRVQYLKRKQALYLKYLNECDAECFEAMSQFSKKSTAGKKKTPRKVQNLDEDVKNNAQMLASEIVGPFTDPFDSNSIKHRDSYDYCCGNMILCYLNLSYNNLSFLSVKKILKVVTYQNLSKKSNQSGLIKVVIEGNNLPMSADLALLSDLFDRNIKNQTDSSIRRRRPSRQ